MGRDAWPFMARSRFRLGNIDGIKTSSLSISLDSLFLMMDLTCNHRTLSMKMNFKCSPISIVFNPKGIEYHNYDTEISPKNNI